MKSSIPADINSLADQGLVALRRAAKRAQDTALAMNSPCYVAKQGQVVDLTAIRKRHQKQSLQLIPNKSKKSVKLDLTPLLKKRSRKGKPSQNARPGSLVAPKKKARKRILSK